MPSPPVQQRQQQDRVQNNSFVESKTDNKKNNIIKKKSSMSILDRMISKHERGSFLNNNNDNNHNNNDDGKDRQSTVADMYDDDDDDDDEGDGGHEQYQRHQMIEPQRPPAAAAQNRHRPDHPIGAGGAIVKELAVRLNDDDPSDTRPPPVTDLHPNFHDDDSVSQITSSIASHSYYNSLSAGSWGQSKKSKSQQELMQQQQQQQQASVGEPSLADTLDEIANMLQPTTSQQQGITTATTTPAINGRSSGRRPYSATQLEKIYEAQNQRQATTTTDDAAALPYRKLPSLWEQYPTTTTTTQSASWDTYLNPLVWASHLILQIKNFVSPQDEYYLRKKTDGDRDEDYFDALMGSGSGGRQQRRRKRGSKRGNGGLLGIICRFFVLFCVMTALLLVLRLGMMQAQFQGITSRVSDSKAGHVLRNMMMAADHGGKRGAGLQHRSRYGGMAHHNTDDKVQAQHHQQQQLLQASAGEAGHLKSAMEVDGDAENAAAVRKSGYLHQDHIGLELPPVFENFADVNDMPVLHGVDLPFFWHVPRSMGGTVNDILGGCLGLTIASDAGGQGPAAKTNKLLVTRYPGHFSYVNVDTSSAEGIARARTLGLASSGLAGVVVSTLLHSAASIFTEDNQGRMFTIVRHPIERAVSLFHFVQDTHWRQRETYRKDLADLSIEEYFKSGLSENNWMTRVLVNELTKGELTREDVNLAKEIMRRKCLIGLLKEKGETFARFERYFGWQLKNEEDKDCHEKKLQWAWPLKHRHDEVEEGTPMWDVIMAHNVYDMELYDYAMVLFQEQASLFQ